MIRLTSVVLPAPVGPDDGDGLAGLGDQRQVLDQRVVRVVGERHVVELDPAARAAVGERRRPASGDCSSASSSSKTRSAEAMPDCSTLAIDASWVSGWVNWREYWMNAWTSPSVIAPDDTRRPPIDGDGDVVEVAEEHHRRLDRCRR